MSQDSGQLRLAPRGAPSLDLPGTDGLWSWAVLLAANHLGVTVQVPSSLRVTSFVSLL